MKVSTFDKVFVMKNNGEFRVVSTTDKVFIGRGGIYYINYAEKDIISKEVFTVIYKDKLRDKNVFMIKRFQIPSWTVDKVYSVVPNEKASVKKISMHPSAKIFLKYKTNLGYKILEEEFRFADFDVQKTANGKGRQLTTKELASLSVRPTKDTKTSDEAAPSLFDVLEDQK